MNTHRNELREAALETLGLSLLALIGALFAAAGWYAVLFYAAPGVGTAILALLVGVLTYGVVLAASDARARSTDLAAILRRRDEESVDRW